MNTAERDRPRPVPRSRRRRDHGRHDDHNRTYSSSDDGEEGCRECQNNVFAMHDGSGVRRPGSRGVGGGLGNGTCALVTIVTDTHVIV